MPGTEEKEVKDILDAPPPIDSDEEEARKILDAPPPIPKAAMPVDEDEQELKRILDEPTYDEIRLLQRFRAYRYMPKDYKDFIPDWWQVATYMGKKGDKQALDDLETVRRKIFDEGKNLNEIPGAWSFLSPETKQAVALVLGKSGALEEMVGETAEDTPEYEASPVAEAARMGQWARIEAPPVYLTVREGELPPKYKWKALGRQGLLEGFGLEQLPLPFEPTIVSLKRTGELRSALDVLEKADKPDSTVTEREALDAAYIVKKHQEYAEYEDVRGSSIPKQIRDIISGSISVGLEIGAMGWVGKIAAKGAKSLAALALKRAGVTLLSKTGRVTLRATGFFTQAGVRVAFGPHRIAEYYEQARLQGVSPGWALTGGIADLFIMHIAEMSGKQLAKFAKMIPLGGEARLRLPFISKLLWKLEKGVEKGLLNRGTSRLWNTLRTMGYHGPIGEKAEERFEELISAIVGTKDYRLSPEEANMLTRWIASRPDIEQHIVEMVSFTLPSVGVMGMRVAGQKIAQRSLAKGPQWVAKQKAYKAKFDSAKQEAEIVDAQPARIPRRVVVEEKKTAAWERLEVREGETTEQVVADVVGKLEVEEVEKPVVPPMPEIPEPIIEKAVLKPEYPIEELDLTTHVIDAEGKAISIEETVEGLPSEGMTAQEIFGRKWSEPYADKRAREARNRTAREEYKALKRDARLGRKGAKARLKKYETRAKTRKSRQKAAAQEVNDTLKEARAANLRPEFKKVVDAIAALFKLKKMIPKQARTFVETTDKYAADPTRVTYSKYKYAKRRLAERDRPTLRDLPEAQIQKINALLQDMIEQNAFKQKEVTRLLNEKMRIAMQSIIEGLKTLYGEKYKPGIRGIPRRITRFITKPIGLKYMFYNYESLIRTLAPPGTAAYEVLYDDALKADLIDTPKIIQESIDAVKAEAKRQGIDIDLWETEVLNQPLYGEVKDERGNIVESLPFTRMELADLYNTQDDPDSYEQLKQKGAEGIKLSPKSALKVKLGKETLRRLKALEGLPEAERRKIIRFARWLKDSEHDWRFANLYTQAQLDIRGYARPLREGYYPRTREPEFLEGEREERGRPERARKVSEAPIVIQSALARLAYHSDYIASLASKSVVNKRMEALLGDRDVLQAIRSNVRNADYLLKRIKSNQAVWMGKDKTPKEWYDKLIKFLTRAAHVGALGWNIPVAVYQQFSRLTVLSHQGSGFSKYLFAARTFSPRQIGDMDAWLRKNVPWIRQRFERSVHGIITPEADSLIVAERYGAKGGILRRGIKGYSRASMMHIQVADRVTINQIAIAFKLKGLDMGLEGQELDNYIKDQIVREVVATQPSSDALSLTGWHIAAREHPFLVKPFVMFTSPLIKQCNQIIQALQDFSFKEKTGTLTPADFGELGFRVSIPLVVNSFLITMTKYGFDALRNWLIGVDDDKGTVGIIENFVNRASGNLVVAGPHLYSAGNLIVQRGRGKRAYEPGSNIVEDSIIELCYGISDAFKAAGTRSPKKSAKALKRSISKFLRGGEIFGAPGGAVGPWYDRFAFKKRYGKRRK